MNINEHERHEMQVCQRQEMAAVKMTAYALLFLFFGCLLLFCGCSSKQPVPSVIIPPAAAPRMASRAIVTSNGCQVITGHDRRGKTFTVTNCPVAGLFTTNEFVGTETGIWSLQTSSDLRNWQTIETNLFCVFQFQNKVPVISRAGGYAYFRMVKE